MKTSVEMKRELWGGEISQNSQTGFFSATDLVRLGNKWRVENGLPFFNLNTYFTTKSTKEFCEILQASEGKIKINAKGKGQHTWVHPYLFIDIALAINTELKITVYKWIYDELIKYRNKSGDSYKKMAGALYLSINNKSKFKETLIDFANKIKNECGVEDWQHATEQQLELRNKIHEYVSIFSDIIHDEKNLIEVSIEKAKSSLTND